MNKPSLPTTMLLGSADRLLTRLRDLHARVTEPATNDGHNNGRHAVNKFATLRETRRVVLITSS